MDDTYERLLPLISIATGSESEDISDSSDFIKDLSLDSMGSVELAMELEYEFGVKIERDDISSLVTVGDLVSYIDNKIQ